MKKLFTNDKFFGIVTILAIACTIFFFGVYIIIVPEYYMYLISNLVSAICVAVLFISYKKHSKNVMKGMLGALLMQLFTELWLTTELTIDAFDNVLSIIVIASITFLLINHFIINSNRKASPVAIFLNQLFCVLFAIALATDTIYWIPFHELLIMKVADVCTAIASICTAAVIVCVESRLDAYRKDREAAGWTEEKGYPEGYVHEYEKK